MNNENGDATLNRAGNGDATLDRAWRQASDEQPPAQLDAAIIARARDAIRDRAEPTNVIGASRRPRSWLTGWQPLAAAAGVAGLAFILAQSLPRERDVAPSIRMEERASRPTGAPESLSRPSTREVQDEKAAAATAPVSAKVPTAATESEQTKRAVAPPPAPPHTVSVPRAASVAGAMDKDTSADGTATTRAIEADQQQEPMPEMASQAASEAAAAPARERRRLAPLSAEEWAARVAALYAAGDAAGAADKLRAFRGADPDADTYLPESIREWARTVE